MQYHFFSCHLNPKSRLNSLIQHFYTCNRTGEVICYLGLIISYGKPVWVRKHLFFNLFIQVVSLICHLILKHLLGASLSSVFVQTLKVVSHIKCII